MIVPAFGVLLVAVTVRVRPVPDTVTLDHPVDVPERAKSDAVTSVTSSEKVTVQDCSLKSFGEVLSDTIDVTVGAVRSTIHGALWASPVSMSITRDAESNEAASLRPSALDVSPHGDCDDSGMFGVVGSDGLAPAVSTARTVKLLRLATHARLPSGENTIPIGPLKPPTVETTALVEVLMIDTELLAKFATATRVPELFTARWYGLTPTPIVETTAKVVPLMTVTLLELTFEVQTRVPSGETAIEFG